MIFFQQDQLDHVVQLGNQVRREALVHLGPLAGLDFLDQVVNEVMKETQALLDNQDQQAREDLQAQVVKLETEVPQVKQDLKDHKDHQDQEDLLDLRVTLVQLVPKELKDNVDLMGLQEFLEKLEIPELLVQMDRQDNQDSKVPRVWWATLAFKEKVDQQEREDLPDPLEKEDLQDLQDHLAL